MTGTAAFRILFRRILSGPFPPLAKGEPCLNLSDRRVLIGLADDGSSTLELITLEQLNQRLALVPIGSLSKVEADFARINPPPPIPGLTDPVYLGQRAGFSWTSDSTQFTSDRFFLTKPSMIAQFRFNSSSSGSYPVFLTSFGVGQWAYLWLGTYALNQFHSVLVVNLPPDKDYFLGMQATGRGLGWMQRFWEGT